MAWACLVCSQPNPPCFKLLAAACHTPLWRHSLQQQTQQHGTLQPHPPATATAPTAASAAPPAAAAVALVRAQQPVSTTTATTLVLQQAGQARVAAPPTQVVWVCSHPPPLAATVMVARGARRVVREAGARLVAGCGVCCTWRALGGAPHPPVSSWAWCERGGHHVVVMKVLSCLSC